MFNSKSIHFALLGIIVGSAVAYLFGSYRLEVRRQFEAEAAAQALSAQPADHPEVTDEAMLAFFEEALAANPNDTELMSRYAGVLFERQRFAEAADWFGRVVALDPEDVAVRTAMAAALYGSGRSGEAIVEFQRAIAVDPNYTLALHNLALAYLDIGDDLAAAENAIRQLEGVDPAYPGLGSLRQQLELSRGGP